MSKKARVFYQVLDDTQKHLLLFHEGLANKVIVKRELMLTHTRRYHSQSIWMGTPCHIFEFWFFHRAAPISRIRVYFESIKLSRILRATYPSILWHDGSKLFRFSDTATLFWLSLSHIYYSPIRGILTHGVMDAWLCSISTYSSPRQSLKF